MKLTAVSRCQARSDGLAALLCALTALACSDRGDLQVGLLKTPAGECAVVERPDYCSSVPAIEQPVIDAQLDCGLELQPVPTHTATRAGLPAGIEARYAVGHSSAGLYYFVQVVKDELRPPQVEDPLFCGDAVQLFADTDGAHPLAPSYDEPGTAQFVVPAPDAGQQSTSRGAMYVYAPGREGASPWTSSQFISASTPDGYVVEALISGADLGVPQLRLRSGQRVGLDVWICVGGERLSSNDCGNRVNDYGLHVADSQQGLQRVPHFNSAAFCDPSLAD